MKFVNSGAGGSNNGTTWANGWTNVSSIVWSGLAAGDTVCVAGGSYGTITTGKSGTSGNPITIRRATAADATCGSSTAGWSSGFDAQVVLVGIVLQNDYTTIDGAVTNGITLALNHNDGWVLGVTGPTTGVVVQYVEVSGPCGTTACNQSNDDRNLSLINWNGSSYDLQTNFSVIHDNFHGGCTLLITYHSTGLIVDHTRFADSADSTPGNPNCHPNVLESGGDVNAIFRYNEVTNWEVEGIMVCPNGACTANWDVYGNIWHDPIASGVARVFESQANANGPHHSYNNSYINIPFSSFGTANGGSYATGSASLNDIFYATPTPGLPSADFGACNGSTCGQTNGQSITSSIFVNFSAKTVAGYALASDTTAGTTLSSPFNTDLNGTTRAANGTWDRGYFQITGGTPTGPNKGYGFTIFGGRVK